MPKLSIHTPVPEIDDARLRPALRGRTRRLTPRTCTNCGQQISATTCERCTNTTPARD